MTLATGSTGQRPPNASRRAIAGFLWLLAACVLPDGADATTAADICGAGADPCQVTTTINVAPGSVLDFGDRQLLISSRGALTLTGGTMTIRARDLSVAAGGSLFARGTATAPGGKIIATVGTLTIGGIVDATGTPGGAVSVTADGAVLVTGTLDVSASSTGSGGSIDVQAGSLTISGSGKVTASGRSDSFGGEVTIRSADIVSITGTVIAGGGDGGAIDIGTNGNFSIAGAATLTADGVAVGGSGGSIDLSALGDLSIDGAVSAAGKAGNTDTGGGDGGSITASGRSLKMSRSAAQLNVSAGLPDGVGGDIEVSSDSGAITINGSLFARSPGVDGAGGTISVDAGGDLTLAGTIDCTGGTEGGGQVDTSSGGTTTLPNGAMITVAARTTGAAGDIDMDSGPLLAVGGKLIADGGPTGGAGGTISVAGCTVQIDDTGLLTSLQTGGTNTLVGRDLTAVRGTLRADAGGGSNVIRYAGPEYDPALLPGARINPPAALVIDDTIQPCNPVDATPTATPTGSGGGQTPTPTPTPTLPAGTGCTGDCDHSNTVTVAELIIGVNIAIGNQPVANCPAFDVNGDGQVGINELVQAVGNALNGCRTS
jgi:hypothetical protein